MFMISNLFGCTGGVYLFHSLKRVLPEWISVNAVCLNWLKSPTWILFRDDFMSQKWAQFQIEQLLFGYMMLISMLYVLVCQYVLYQFFSNLLGLISFHLVCSFMEADLYHQSPCNVHLKEVSGLRKEFDYKIYKSSNDVRFLCRESRF